MNPRVRNILVVIVALVIGSIANGALISISSTLIPPPEGANLKTMEGLIEAMPLMEPRHFLMPFLAHAMGTLVAAIITTLFVIGNKIRYAIGIGIAFLIAGSINVIMLPAPMWFNIVDLTLAYIPMSLLGYKLVTVAKKD